MEDDEANAIAILNGGIRESPTDCPSSPKGARTPSTNKRWRITPKALELLECVYAKEACPSNATRDALAVQLGATPRQVQVWFQNKRQRRAIKAKREQEIGKASSSPSSTPVVPETISSAQLFDLPGGSPPPLESPMKPEASPARPPQSPAPPRPVAQRPGAAPATEPPRNRRTVDSLADLACVAECVDSIEHLTGGLAGVNSLKDLASLSRDGSLRDLCHLGKDLASLSRVVSLADLASFAGTLSAPQPAAQQMCQ